MVRRWDGGWWSKGGTDMQRNGEMVMYRRYNELHWIIVASLKVSRGSARGVDVSTFRVGEGVA